MADLRAAAQQALEFVTSEQWGTVPYMRGDVYSDAQELEDTLRAALAQQDEPGRDLHAETERLFKLCDDQDSVIRRQRGERLKLEAERDALKADNERLSRIVAAANWNRAQEEHNALRAQRDALVDEKYRLRHLLAQARFFVDRAPHGDERDCPVCEFVNRIDAALAEKGGGNG